MIENPRKKLSDEQLGTLRKAITDFKSGRSY
jgi:hypothetical protein